MKAIILLATLKKQGLSNTEALSEFFVSKLKIAGVDGEIIKLVNENVLPGTYTDMGAGDGWPGVLQKIIEAQMVIFATPVWWGSHSSEMQKAIERLDHIHDGIMAGKGSVLQNKVGGIIVTGDSDGAEQIIGNIFNFMNAIGIVIPPYSSLSVLWEGQKKGATTTKKELMKKYEDDYAKAAETMVDQLVKLAH